MKLALLVLVACGPQSTRAPTGTGRDRGDLEITLYRDLATVAQRVEVTIPPADTATVRLKIAAGVDPADIYIVDKSELIVRQARSAADHATPAGDGCDEVSCVLDNYERPCCARFERDAKDWEDEDGERPAKPAANLSTSPTDVELVIGGPHPGKYTLLVGYDTDRIQWDAGYTIATTPGHDRGQLRGALAVRNTTGIPLRRGRVRVVDAPRAAARDRAPIKGNDPNATPTPEPRELGTLDLALGDTRIELLPATTARPLRSVLVYDPIGPGIDYQHATPVQDPNLGVVPAPTTRVLESFELERTPAMRHLPAGPVRLLERRIDGTLAMLGETRLFGPTTLAAAVDTVAVGTAEGVTAKRERRELTLDNDRKRVVEEIAITVDNKRAQPVEVVLREHLYRGENWAVAYWSVPDIEKEGKQQIRLRVTVPPRQSKTVLYVVVYSWGQ